MQRIRLGFLQYIKLAQEGIVWLVRQSLLFFLSFLRKRSLRGTLFSQIVTWFFCGASSVALIQFSQLVFQQGSQFLQQPTQLFNTFGSGFLVRIFLYGFQSITQPKAYTSFSFILFIFYEIVLFLGMLLGAFLHRVESGILNGVLQTLLLSLTMILLGQFFSNLQAHVTNSHISLGLDRFMRGVRWINQFAVLGFLAVIFPHAFFGPVVSVFFKTGVLFSGIKILQSLAPRTRQDMWFLWMWQRVFPIFLIVGLIAFGFSFGGK